MAQFKFVIHIILKQEKQIQIKSNKQGGSNKNQITPNKEHYQFILIFASFYNLLGFELGKEINLILFLAINTSTQKVFENSYFWNI